ncbi:MAG: hypothetical protein M3Y74_03260, partial [Chloroflexota bacterium]|nr:hypothetical protein [Chloroflexota bacterium]
VDTTSATNQPFDFSSLSPHIAMESASSKAPKSHFCQDKWADPRETPTGRAPLHRAGVEGVTFVAPNVTVAAPKRRIK